MIWILTLDPSSKQSNKSRTSHICTTLSTFHELSSRTMSRPTLLSGFEDIIKYITGLEESVENQSQEIKKLQEENEKLKEQAKQNDFDIHYYKCFVNAVDPKCHMMNNLIKEDVDAYTQNPDLAKRLCEAFYIDEDDESDEESESEDEPVPEEDVVVEATQVDELPQAVVDTLQSDCAKREVQTENGTTKYTNLKFDCEVGRIQFLMELEVTHGLSYTAHARTTAQNNLRNPQFGELWIEDDSQKKTITFMWYTVGGSMYGRQRVRRA